MRSIKLVHTSDLHLGMTFKALGNKSKLHRNDCKDVFSKIIDVCIKEKTDALLIAGDLFDSYDPQKSLVKFVIGEFERLKKEKINVFISSGNHDPYKKGSVWLEHRFPSNVVVFTSNDMEAKSVNGLTVYGLAYTNDTKEPLKGFVADNTKDFKVGLIHGSTTNINWEENSEAGYRKISKTDLDNSKLDYVALGHFHNTLEIKSKSKCFYAGSPEPLSFKNNKVCSALLVAHKDGNTSVKPIPTNIRKFETFTLDCTNFEDESEIRKVLEKKKDENTIFRLVLMGSPSLNLDLDIGSLEREFDQKYFFLKIVDNIHLPENLSEDETIRGHFIKIVRAEIKKEKNDEKKKRLENALRIGVGYLDKKM